MKRLPTPEEIEHWRTCENVVHDCWTCTRILWLPVDKSIPEE